MKQLPVGVVAPDFNLRTWDGRSFELRQAILERPVVLAFYKASYPTCQLTFPYLQQIHSESPNHSNLRICGVSQDETTETGSFVAQFGITFDVLIDEHPYRVSANYGLDFVPSIFLVGMDGKIQLSDYGFSKATLSELAKPLQLFSPDEGLPATRPA